MASSQDPAPNSQASSFVSSQGSLYIPDSGGNFSSSQTRLPRDVTPSTSLSNPSSQEQMAEKALQAPSYSARRPGEPTTIDTRFAQAPVADMGSAHANHASALKRTADGQVKQGGSLSPTSPIKTPRYEHSRTASTASRDSQISELTNSLKTRLTYAALKVQNGWETRNINDLEAHINSTQTSPISTTSTLRRPYESPRPGSSSTQSGGFLQSSEWSTATATPEQHAPHRHVGTAGLDYAYPQLSPATKSPPSAHSRTYESFWREHGHSEQNRARHGLPAAKIFPFSPSIAKATASPPSLAPPVDIHPRSARRPSPQHPPPRLHTSTSDTTMPATPPPPSSQPKTAMENDAIETLVFMSSPKNPSYHHQHQRQPRTPLRKQLVDLDRVRGNMPVKSEADIERLMEEVAGESSDSDDVDALEERGGGKVRVKVLRA